MKIITNEEIYYINKNNILYINIYKNKAGLKKIYIRLKHRENIIIDEQDTGIKKMEKLIEMIDSNYI